MKLLTILFSAVMFLAQGALGIERVWNVSTGKAYYSGNRDPILAGPDKSIIVSILQAPNMAAQVSANNRSDGSVVWTYPLTNIMFEPYISSSDDTVYVVTSLKTHAIDLATGVKKWATHVEGTIEATPISQSNSVIVYANDNMNSLDAATGNITWTVSGTFGQCSYFKKPMFNGAGTFLVCGRSAENGIEGVAGIDVKTGVRRYFKEHTNPSPFYVDQQRLIFLDLNHAAWHEDVVHCISSEHGHSLWKFHPNHQHTAGAVAGTTVVIGTWGMNFGLDLTTGASLWNVSDPVGPTFRTFPLPCGSSSGIAFFHVQTEGNFKQTMRRIQLSDGTVQWNSNVDIHSNGLLQFQYIESEDAIAMRGKNTIRVWNWGNGTELSTKTLHEIEVTAWEGDHFYLGMGSKLEGYTVV